MEKNLPPANDDLETVIVPLMLYSDSTRLASFGTASLWPLYMWFGGLSKYIRSTVNSFSANHLAYFPSLPDLVQDHYKEIFDTIPSKSILTHLKRELMQAAWKVILTDEFKHIYKHGIVLTCGDGIRRRLYPRFFCYSADYPE
ncbi:hypothetical protein C0992_000423, partial [Termitomyces sp. T32_za158]